MALKKCPECKKDVSSSAEKCPHCGYKLEKNFFWLIVGVLIFLSIIYRLVGHDDNIANSNVEKQYAELNVVYTKKSDDKAKIMRSDKAMVLWDKIYEDTLDIEVRKHCDSVFWEICLKPFRNSNHDSGRYEECVNEYSLFHSYNRDLDEKCRVAAANIAADKANKAVPLDSTYEEMCNENEKNKKDCQKVEKFMKDNNFK